MDDQHPYIAPALRHLAVPIDQLTPDPANVRQHSERNLGIIAASLKRFGQQRPVLVDDKGIVRAGNGTLTAARTLGWSHIAAVQSDLKGADLIAYAIADNRSGDPEVGSLWDTHGLSATLDALRAEDGDLATITGFTADEIGMLLSAQGKIDELPAEAAGREVDESVADGVKTITCPHCGKAVPV